MILAVIIGPIVAVVITLWWQQRKEKRDTKTRLFITLMAFRKSYPIISYDFANQLNLIDVVFSDTEKVVSLWHDYYSLLQRQNTDTLQLQEQNHKYLELLSRMGAELGFKHLQQTDIDKFYIPQIHMDQNHLNSECQREWLRVLKNTAKINVETNQK
jgi:hypothetical protein